MFKTICTRCGKYAKVSERQLSERYSICTKCADAAKGKTVLSNLKYDILGFCIMVILIVICLSNK